MSGRHALFIPGPTHVPDRILRALSRPMEDHRGADFPLFSRRLLLDLKRRHYAEWPDQALPALDGLSPREAVRTAQGRNAVDVLLKDMENHEQRSAGAEAFDFTHLWRELRLD